MTILLNCQSIYSGQRRMKRKRDISHFFKSGSTTEEKREKEEENPEEVLEACSEDVAREQTGTEGARAHDEASIPGPAGNVLLLNWMFVKIMA